MFLFLSLIYSVSTLDPLTLLLTTHLTLQLGSLYYSLKSAEEVIFQTILVLLLYILSLHNQQLKEITPLKILIS